MPIYDKSSHGLWPAELKMTIRQLLTKHYTESERLSLMNSTWNLVVLQKVKIPDWGMPLATLQHLRNWRFKCKQWFI